MDVERIGNDGTRNLSGTTSLRFISSVQIAVKDEPGDLGNISHRAKDVPFSAA